MDMIVKVTPEMQKRIAEFCKEMGIAKLALFDPDLQGRPNPHVDVYALIEFAPGVKGTDFSVVVRRAGGRVGGDYRLPHGSANCY